MEIVTTMLGAVRMKESNICRAFGTASGLTCLVPEPVFPTRVPGLMVSSDTWSLPWSDTGKSGN